MADMTAALLLSLRDRLSPGLGRASQKFGRLQKSGQAAIGRLNAGLGKLNGTLATLGVTVGLGAAVKGVVELDKRITRLQTNAGMTAEKAQALKKQIFAVANMPDIKIGTDTLYESIEKIVEKTGDIQFVEDNMELLARTIQATDAAGRDVGSFAADLQTSGFKPEEMQGILGTLIQQGKNGSFVFKDLGNKMGKLWSDYQVTTGRKAAEDIIKLGATLQVAQKGINDADQTATSFMALMRSVAKPATQKALQKTFNFDVLDANGKIKSIDVLTKGLAEIALKSTESSGKLRTVLADSEAFKFLGGAISYGTEQINKFNSYTGDMNTIQKDAAINAQTFAANMQSLQTSFAQFADANLAEPIGRLADKLNELKPEQIQTAFRAIAWGLRAIVAAKGISSVVGMLNSLRPLLSRGRKGLPGMPSSPVSAIGAQPVFVTNWPASMGANPLLPNSGGGKGLTKKGYLAALSRRKGFLGMAGRGVRLFNTTGTGRMLARGGRMLGRFGGPALGVGLGVLDAARALGNDQLSSRQKSKAVGGTAGGTIGAIAGGALGTLIPVPVVGTVLGAMAGGFIGDKLGSLVGGMFGSDASIMPEPPMAQNIAPEPVEVTINLDAQMDESTRLRVSKVASESRNIQVNTGNWAGANP